MPEKYENVPSTEEANYLLFSMHSLEGIKGNLKQFRVCDFNKNVWDNKALSATLLWSGTENNNTPVNFFEDKTDNPCNIGFVLNPALLDIPQADMVAYRSGGLLFPETLKKDTWVGNDFGDVQCKTNHPVKMGYKRVMGGQEAFATNIARHEVLSQNKESVYHPKGSHEILAKNIWQKYHKGKRHRCPKDSNVMRFNEALCFQKTEKNPIDGLLVTQNINEKVAADLLLVLKNNPNLKLYFYDSKAKAHIVRFYNNEQAKNYLESIINAGPRNCDHFGTAFENASVFKGFQLNMAPPKFSKTNAAFFGEDKSSNQLNMENVEKPHLQAIFEAITILQKEVDSCWPYPNKDRKLNKIAGLELLMVKMELMDVSDAIAETEAVFPDLREGAISTRTAKLLDSLINTGLNPQL